MGSWRVPLFLVALVVVAGVAGMVVVKLVGTHFEEDPPYSLCPADRFVDGIVTTARVLDEAGAYTGKGPHRLIVDGPSGATEALREDWVVPRERDGRFRTEQLQLVVCEFRHSVTARSATYNYKIYEARRGELLGTFNLKGVDVAGVGEALPDFDELERMLKPFVMADLS